MHGVTVNIPPNPTFLKFIREIYNLKWEKLELLYKQCANIRIRVFKQ